MSGAFDYEKEIAKYRALIKEDSPTDSQDQIEVALHITLLTRNQPRTALISLIHEREVCERYGYNWERSWKQTRKYEGYRCSPFGIWTPKYHWTCSDAIHTEIVLWLCIQRSAQHPPSSILDKSVTLLICSFICTLYNSTSPRSLIDGRKDTIVYK